MGHPEALGFCDRAWPAAATPEDRDRDVAVSPSVLLTPAQPIAVTTAGTGGTAPCQAPRSCQVFPPSSRHHAPTASLETNTPCGNRHCPLLPTLWIPVMDNTSLSKKEDIFAIKCMVRNT